MRVLSIQLGYVVSVLTSVRHLFPIFQGWVESVDASVTHVLRTTLAKAAKDQTLNPQPLQMPEDTTKVKKHIALMIDKLGKGARLVEGLPTNATGKWRNKNYISVLSLNCVLVMFLG